jgi:hypothetical protein
MSRFYGKEHEKVVAFKKSGARAGDANTSSLASDIVSVVECSQHPYFRSSMVMRALLGNYC